MTILLMDQLETAWLKEIENSITLTRRQCRPAKTITFEDLYFSQRLHNIVGDYFPPHLLYQFTVHYNDTFWFKTNEYMINSEKHSYESKKSYLAEDDGDYTDYMYEAWEDILSNDQDKLVNMVFKFQHHVADKWDVNSAARSVIDNLLIAAWHYRDALTKE